MFKKLSKTHPEATKKTQKKANSMKKDSAEDIIIVDHLSKSFKLPTERSWGLKQAIFNRLKGIKGYTKQEVLKDISFNVKKGEFLGIVGRNGSGKSTLLKILAQIYVPDSGNITINGSLAPFMDQKLKNYSSGMQVRLAFSIAIRARGDILILDEILAVGDAAFQEKCNQYFASLNKNQTVILVTHSMENVRKFCDRAILIDQGKIIKEGDPEIVADAYLKLFN